MTFDYCDLCMRAYVRAYAQCDISQETKHAACEKALNFSLTEQ